MPEIILTSLADALGGAVPADAVLTANATRSRTVGAAVIANGSVRARLVAGVPTEPLILDASGPDWCWFLRLDFPQIRASVRRWVAVPDVGPVEWSDLVDVDPATLAPSEGAVPAWTAAVNEVSAALTATMTARDTALLASSVAVPAAAEAVEARDASTIARNEAEVFAAGTVALQDEAIAQAIRTEGSETRTQLNATVGGQLSVAVGDGVAGAADQLFVSRYAAGTPTQLVTPTYDGSGQTVHPSVLHIPGGLGGYEWWMAHTPYRNAIDTYENPSILASHDGLTWVTPTGLTNPIDTPANPTRYVRYNNDTNLVLHNGELHCFWRYLDDNRLYVYVRTSSDGVTWTPKTVVADDGSDLGKRAVQFIHDGDGWWMYYTRSPAGLFRARGSELTPAGWQAQEPVTVHGVPTGTLWHTEVRKHAGRWYAVIATTDRRMWIADSTDGLVFHAGAELLSKERPGVYDGLYHSSVTPEVRESGTRWHLFLAAFRNIPGGTAWNLHHTMLQPLDRTSGELVFPKRTDQVRVVPGSTTVLDLSSGAAIDLLPVDDLPYSATVAIRGGSGVVIVDGRVLTPRGSSAWPVTWTGSEWIFESAPLDITPKPIELIAGPWTGSVEGTVIFVGRYQAVGDWQYVFDARPGVASTPGYRAWRASAPISAPDGTFGTVTHASGIVNVWANHSGLLSISRSSSSDTGNFVGDFIAARFASVLSTEERTTAISALTALINPS